MRARLQKLLAAAGVASRRRAEALLADGRVRVNGRVARLGDSADPDVDRVEVDGRPLAAVAPAFWLLHKPRGVLTTTRDPHGRRTVLDLLPPRAARLRLFPVGRLDLESEGLLLLTNDGDVAQALLHPSRGSEREYRVRVRGRLDAGALRRLREGVWLAEGRSAPVRTGRPGYDAASDTTTLSLILVEGRKRQIRRAMRALGHPVVSLVRIRMGPLHLGGLPAGRARPLTGPERERLLAHARRHGAPARGAR